MTGVQTCALPIFDGLYLMIADEEKALRQDPVGAASSVVQKVFGALK